MINNKLKSWLAIAISEVMLALILMAIAPTWLNSKKPIFGFLIWFAVPTMLGTSSIYAVKKLTAANQAKNIFITEFPEHSALKATDFLELSPEWVSSQISLLKEIKETSAIQEFDISLFEILEQTKHEKN